MNTKLKITNQANGKSCIVFVKDRGPAKRLKRGIDLGKDAFASIANLKDGLATVTIEEVQ